eukprot:COSAG01_NODE_5281_length_4359_cov_1.386620_1_plen_81_part_00
MVRVYQAIQAILVALAELLSTTYGSGPEILSPPHAFVLRLFILHACPDSGVVQDYIDVPTTTSHHLDLLGGRHDATPKLL